MRLLLSFAVVLTFSVPAAAAPRERTRYLLEDHAAGQWCIYDDWKTVNDDVERIAGALPEDWGVYRAASVKYVRGDLRQVGVFNNAASGDWLFDDIYTLGKDGLSGLTRELRSLNPNLSETTRYAIKAGAFTRQGVRRQPLTRNTRIGAIDWLPNEPEIYVRLADVPFLPLLAVGPLKPGERECRPAAPDKGKPVPPRPENAARR